MKKKEKPMLCPNCKKPTAVYTTKPVVSCSKKGCFESALAKLGIKL